MPETFRLRVVYEGPDKNGLFTARAMGVSGNVVGLGHTQLEARRKVLEALRPLIPENASKALMAQEAGLESRIGRPTGVRRYWRNLSRGWPVIGAMMCLYGIADKSGLATIGAVSFIIWGIAVMLNLGDAADAILSGRIHEVRFVNGVRQRAWRVTLIGLAGSVVGVALTVVFAQRYH